MTQFHVWNPRDGIVLLTELDDQRDKLSVDRARATVIKLS